MTVPAAFWPPSSAAQRRLHMLAVEDGRSCVWRIREESQMTQAIYGANVSDEERAEALMTDAYARCVQVARFLRKLSAIRPAASAPTASSICRRATMNDAIRIMQLAEVNRDV